MDIGELINSSISSVTLVIITVILGLDSIRAVLASIGIFDPNSKFGRVIYGKRDKSILTATLRDLGYSAETTDEIVIKMKEIQKSAFIKNAGVNDEDAAIQLIIMLSKYIFKFDDVIVYGGTSLTKSKYYIDTMEISHSKEDKQKLAAIMIYLIRAKRKKKPEVIITPKGGNPLFSQQVANAMNSNLLVAKSSTDKSKVKITNEAVYPQKEFLINYEGSWFLNDAKNKRDCIVVDCNTSGGSQLLDIVTDIRSLTDKGKNSVMIQTPSEVFVLFRVDIDGDNLDKKFNAYQCKIHRFFDLDENAKAKMYDLKRSRQEKGRNPSYYCDDDIKETKEIINYLESKNLFYYRPQKVKIETIKQKSQFAEQQNQPQDQSVELQDQIKDQSSNSESTVYDITNKC